MQQLLSKLKKVWTDVLIFGLIISLMGVFTLATPASANYREECENEGCNTEEISELYNSYKSECIDSSCSKQDVQNIAGHKYSEGLRRMFAAFSSINRIDFTKGFELGQEYAG